MKPKLQAAIDRVIELCKSGRIIVEQKEIPPKVEITDFDPEVRPVTLMDIPAGTMDKELLLASMCVFYSRFQAMGDMKCYRKYIEIKNEALNRLIWSETKDGK